MDSGIWRIETTLDDEAQAKSICRAAVEKGLAACVQMEAPMTSVYEWEGKVHSTSEIRLVFKTSSAKRDLLLSWLKETHPYDVPELIASPIALASDEYACWVQDL